MTPKGIESDQEHAAVLTRIDRLMDAAPGSKEEEELEFWSLLVERYEEQRFPIDDPDPE